MSKAGSKNRDNTAERNKDGSVVRNVTVDEIKKPVKLQRLRDIFHSTAKADYVDPVGKLFITEYLSREELDAAREFERRTDAYCRLQDIASPNAKIINLAAIRGTRSQREPTERQIARIKSKYLEMVDILKDMDRKNLRYFGAVNAATRRHIEPGDVTSHYYERDVLKKGLGKLSELLITGLPNQKN